MSPVSFVLTIGGMNCGHCVKAVTEALSALPFVSGGLEVEVGRARFRGSAADEAALREALDDAGFELLSVTREP